MSADFWPHFVELAIFLITLFTMLYCKIKWNMAEDRADRLEYEKAMLIEEKSMLERRSMAYYRAMSKYGSGLLLHMADAAKHHHLNSRG